MGRFLQAEVSQLKEAHAAAVTEAAAGQEEVEALRSALRTVEGRLKEYQHKDAEVGECAWVLGRCLHCQMTG
jgi:FtsZ-binding cell division protein ZapB